MELSFEKNHGGFGYEKSIDLVSHAGAVVRGTRGLRVESGRRRAGSGAQNVNWDVFPDIDLQPGYYCIVDSDPSTWSSNEESGGMYFTEIRGTATRLS